MTLQNAVAEHVTTVLTVSQLLSLASQHLKSSVLYALGPPYVCRKDSVFPVTQVLIFVSFPMGSSSSFVGDRQIPLKVDSHCKLAFQMCFVLLPLKMYFENRLFFAILFTS